MLMAWLVHHFTCTSVSSIALRIFHFWISKMEGVKKRHKLGCCLKGGWVWWFFNLVKAVMTNVFLWGDVREFSIFLTYGFVFRSPWLVCIMWMITWLLDSETILLAQSFVMSGRKTWLLRRAWSCWRSVCWSCFTGTALQSTNSRFVSS